MPIDKKKLLGVPNGAPSYKKQILALLTSDKSKAYATEDFEEVLGANIDYYCLGIAEGELELEGKIISKRLDQVTYWYAV